MDELLIDWSRAQFALTAIYHWLFVPLTLGLSFIIAFMHTIYIKTNNEDWKRITKFWMKLFGINFAIGVATGIILEFEFGTNWSNYSWFVGDIFGAPLAIEGIFAFFIESTFIAVMFFGWGRVNKKFHLLSSWLVAIGSNLSAIWILVANAWMQNPVGMRFNPDTVRNEMDNFFDILLSPTAVSKFLHTISNAYVVSSLFVIGISSWYILKNRHILFAKKSILIASIFGLLASVFLAITGDSSAYEVAQKQPMKFAAMEGMYNGKQGAGLVTIGILNPSKEFNDNKNEYIFALKIPKLLSLMAYRDANSFVPGINDLLNGNKKQGIISTDEKIEKGKISINALADYKQAKKDKNNEEAKKQLKLLEDNYKYFGYGYFKDKRDIVPPVGLTFYSFHLMVALGIFFIILFFLVLHSILKDKLENKPWLLKLALWSIPLGYIASELGWVVAEVGRQPWTIQNILPVSVSTSHLSVTTVQTTFWIFAVLFSILLIAEIKILLHQIKLGPKNMEE
ncbi:MAG: cytochrome ubiquinol oxidase subunit I [Bacteroidales bacterium]|nr:cytochrome ubiquinol oxidase subunit I [Bacteroidales bacterium]